MTAVKTSQVNKTVEPFVDTGNLLIIDRDPHEFDNKKNVVPTNDELLSLTRDNVQYLINEVWKLPRTTVEDATCAELPKVRFIVPREKPIPQKAPLTRWQKFAQAKGIASKSNRAKKVWDEETQTWKPRYGYNRANDDTKQWLIEIPDNKDPNVDYFQERTDAKRERVAKNQLQHLKNVKRQFNEVSRRNPNDPALNMARGANAIPLGVAADSKLRTKNELGYQIHNAKQATASAGKFQEKIKGEKTPKLGIKRKFDPNEQDVKSERSKQLQILEKMSAKKPKINQARINAAAEAIEQPQKQQNTNKNRKSGGAKKR